MVPGSLGELLTHEFAQIVVAVGFAIIPFLSKRFRTWVVARIKKLFDNGHPPFDASDVEQNRAIEEALFELRLKMGASRAYVFQFHNGGEFASKLPIWRLSCTHEVCAKGVSHEAPKLRDIFASNIWEGLEVLFVETTVPGIKRVSPEVCASKPCSLPRGTYKYTISEMAESPLRGMYESRGVKHLIGSPLLNMDNRVIGFVGVEYMSEEGPGAEVEACDVCRTATAVSLIMFYRKRASEARKQ